MKRLPMCSRPFAKGAPIPMRRVYHHDRQYVVQSGETITSIAWDVGEPYLYIQQANGGLQSVSVGQSITIPFARQSSTLSGCT